MSSKNSTPSIDGFIFIVQPMKIIAINIFLYCLFSFKYEIFGEIRIDDLLVVVSSLVAFWFFLSKGAKRALIFANFPVVLFLSFILINIFSSVYNFSIGRVDFVQAILFSFRHFEYFVFAFLGYILVYYRFNFSIWLLIYMAYVLALIPLQSYGLVPVFSGFSPDRAIANTGGPWELAAVVAFLFFYFLEHRYFYFVLASFVVLVLTESRVTLAATLLSCWLNLSRSYSPAGFVFLHLSCAFFIILVIAVLLVFPGDLHPVLSSERNVVHRVFSFFNYETLAYVLNAAGSAESVSTSEEFLSLSLGEKLGGELEALSGDHSAIVRFTNWAILVKSVFQSVDSVFFGLGPSFAGKAVDGGFVRIFVETGLLGLALYLAFIVSALATARSKVVFYYLLILSVSAIFIDIFTTYKAMFLFWVFYGRDLYSKGADQKLL